MSRSTPVPEKLLESRVAAFHAELMTKVPLEVVHTIDGEISAIVRSGAGANAPRVGDVPPAFELPDARGGMLSLAAALKTGHAVVTFYRGQWCPYCDLQLRSYQQILPELRALGTTLIAISPQTPDESLSTAEKRNLEFAVLSDANNRVARAYGLVFELSRALDSVQKGFGVDLQRSNGDASGELPVPGTFIVSREGRVVFRYVNADYRQRLEPAELLRQLQTLAPDSR